MERISIFNYEAFYLDHLEGNLNEEDTALLLSFLSNHPELEVSLDDMPILPIEDGVFVSPSFENLKQVDYDSDVINMSNIETFAIAYSEKQLSEVKEAELKVFIAHNKEAKEIVFLFEAVKLDPDHSVIFDGKSFLKQQSNRLIWRYSAIAASIIGFVFIAQFWFNNVNQGNTEVFANETLDDRFNMNGKRLVSAGNMNADTNLKGNGQAIILNATSSSPSSKNNTLAFKKSTDIQFAQFNAKPIEIKAYQAKDGIKVIEYPLHPVNQTNPEAFNDVALAYSNMANPIKPITNRLSDFTKTEIDVRTAKATEESKGGFYLKIGKLEIERPTRKSN